jgi:hypothetical protein
MTTLERFLGAAGVALAMGLIHAEPAAAVEIRFEARDLVDVTSGDLWQYDYFVSDASFDAGQGFTVYFDHTLYEDLQSLPLGVADWELLLIQPDTMIPATGLYDALAVVPAASLAQPFSLTFTWLGGPGTAPGSQPFETYRDGPGGFVVDFTGRTLPVESPIPEPSTLALMGAGAVMALRKRRKSVDDSSRRVK